MGYKAIYSISTRRAVVICCVCCLVTVTLRDMSEQSVVKRSHPTHLTFSPPPFQLGPLRSCCFCWMEEGWRRRLRGTMEAQLQLEALTSVAQKGTKRRIWSEVTTCRDISRPHCWKQWQRLTLLSPPVFFLFPLNFCQFYSWPQSFYLLMRKSLSSLTLN